MTRDALRDFRSLDPAPDDGSPPDEALLAQLVTPEEPRPRTRRRVSRRLAVAAAAAVAACGAVLAGTALTETSVDVVAAAEKTVGGSDAILHYRTEWRERGRLTGTFETWERPDGSVARTIVGPDGTPTLEIVRSPGRDETYLPAEDELRIAEGPKLNGPAAVSPIGIGSPSGLSTMFERAREGRASVASLGETTVRGTAVHELRFGPEPRPCEELEGKELDATKLYAPFYLYVAKDGYEPVRALTQGCLDGGELVGVSIDYTSFERLPHTPETARLLEMSPHPGAKRVFQRVG